MQNKKQTVLMLAPMGVWMLVAAGCATTAQPESGADAQPMTIAMVDTDEAQYAFRRLVEMAEADRRLPVYQHNAVEPLVDGPQTYERMLEAIAAARESINLETYIFEDGSVGLEFADELKRRARAGVAVRVLYDAVGSLETGKTVFEDMRKAGIQVAVFNPIDPAEGGNPFAANTRDHRKLLIIDHSIAFTGGINISDNYSSTSDEVVTPNMAAEGWRDTHVVVKGPAVAGLERVFFENWLEAGGVLVGSVDDQIIVPEPAGDHLVAVVAAEGGNAEVSPIYSVYIDAMNRARERIWITQAYFVPGSVFIEQLQAAAQRGVDVRVLVPGFTDVEIVLNASRSTYGELLESGVRIFETETTMLHAKTAVIDSRWSTVGSSNLDNRSFLHNDEVNVIVYGEPFARKLEAQFENDLERSREITLDQWGERGLWQRLKETGARVFEYWI